MGNGNKLNTNQIAQNNDTENQDAETSDNQALETQTVENVSEGSEQELVSDVTADQVLEATDQVTVAEQAADASSDEISEKLKTNKQVVLYLIEKFPKCFIAQGEAKPLKIGIFQDITEQLKDDPKVSKTLLRSALRQYTASWRYLHGLKPGAKRIDLDGTECAELEQEHIDHAVQTLKESKQKAFAKKKSSEADGQHQKQSNRNSDASANTRKKDFKPSSKPRVNPKNKQKISEQPKVKQNLKPIALSDVKEGNSVHVILGNSPVAGSVTKIEKDGVQVQLNSGMTIKVKPEHLVN